MTLFPSSPDRDLELLSAYLDNELSPAERRKLERRLTDDPKLQATLAELRTVKTRLAALPKVKPPRNFTLTPAMAGRPTRPAPRLLSVLNWATALAAVLFAVVIASDLSGGLRAPQAAAPAPTANGEAFVAEQAPAAQKSLTATPSPEAAVAMAPAVPEPVEPLTGTVGEGGGGAGDGGRVLEGTPPADAVTQSLAVEAPAPTETALPPTEMATPTLGAQNTSAVAPASGLSRTASPTDPLRFAEIGLGITLILLIAASLALRRQ